MGQKDTRQLMSQGALVPIQVSRDSERPRGRDSEAGDTRGRAWSLGTVQPTCLMCGGAVDTLGCHTGQAIRGVLLFDSLQARRVGYFIEGSALS